MTPKVLSVVVPIGPGGQRISSVGEWLPAALAEEIEVILVHDSENHKERENFKDLIELNTHVNLKSVSVNCGNPGQSRNEGLIHASGSWVTFWDSDDFPLISEFLAMVRQAQTEGAETCIGGFRTRDVEADVLNYFSVCFDSNGILQEIAAHPGIWRFAFHLDLVKNIKFESFPMGEDQAFLLKAVSNLDAISYHPEPVYEYRIGSGNQITSIASRRRDILTSINWLHSNKDTLFTYPLFEYFLVAQKLTGLKNNFTKNPKEITLAILKNLKIRHANILFKIAISRRRQKKRGDLLTLYVAGGLGNQLFQISRALKISPQRQIRVIDASSDNSANDVFQHFKTESAIIIKISGWKKAINKILVAWMLRSSGNNLVGKILQKLFIVPSVLCKIVNGRKSRLCRITDLGFQDRLDEQPNVLIGYFQSHLYVDKKLLESAMELKISPEAKAIIESYREEAIFENPLLVHVRLGDYLNESAIGTLGLDYYLKAFYEMERKQQVNSIWLFSDDPQRAIEIFPVEIQKRIKIISEPGLTAMENLQIMRLCKNYVIANSTYGWWSAQLSWSENAEVFFPKPWFMSMKDPNELAPKTWNPIFGSLHSNSQRN